MRSSRRTWHCSTRSFAATFSQAGQYVGVIAASYALMQFLFAPVLGALSDRFGRRPVLLISLFGLGVDFLIQGFAPNIWWLFVGRILAGIMGASFTTANAYIADISTDETRARNFGFVGMMFGLGFTIGPVLGGFLGLDQLTITILCRGGIGFGELVVWLLRACPNHCRRKNAAVLRLAMSIRFGTIGRLRVYPIVAGLAIVFVCKSLAQRGLENVWVLYTGYRYEWDAEPTDSRWVWSASWRSSCKAGWSVHCRSHRRTAGCDSRDRSSVPSRLWVMGWPVKDG